tara:strand:- start:10 stop:219 length:210 start_codon:yes stop_codon:yes gene_type:complete
VNQKRTNVFFESTLFKSSKVLDRVIVTLLQDFDENREIDRQVDGYKNFDIYYWDSDQDGKVDKMEKYDG